MAFNPHKDPATLEALQDDIYREKILRARSQTVEERLADAFEITNVIFKRMHEGAMWQLKLEDREAGWLEVRRRLERLRRVHEHGRFANEPLVPA